MHPVPPVHSVLFNHYLSKVDPFFEVIVVPKEVDFVGDRPPHTQYGILIIHELTRRRLFAVKHVCKLGFESWLTTVAPYPSHQCWPCSNQKSFAW